MPVTPEIIECICCGKSFAVLRYGRGIPCPHCRNRLDIFPDPLVQVDTAWGGFTVGFLQPGFMEDMIAEAIKDGVKTAAGEMLSPVNILKKILGK
ncbi:MAG: hypothetical protein HYT37_02050 [Candidatus Sungbacteria bacterium]|nr:hypothetical protein [Candidatus Sungbacteria bacterium]